MVVRNQEKNIAELRKKTSITEKQDLNISWHSINIHNVFPNFLR